MTKRPQTVFRNRGVGKNFTPIPNRLLQDSRITRKTKGLLCELLSRPHDWEITVAGIVSAGKEGRDAIYEMIKEAKLYGYIKPEEQEHGEGGTFGKSYYTVTDWPEPCRENPDAAPCRDLPYRENPTQQKKDSNKRKTLSKGAARSVNFLEDQGGLTGNGWRLTWPQIDDTADLCGVDRDKARKLAKLLAAEWAHKGPPKSAFATLRRALMEMARPAPARKATEARTAPVTPRGPVVTCEHGFLPHSCATCRKAARKGAA